MAVLDELIGESAPIRAVRENIERLVGHAPGGRRLPAILIQGETGSGKGLVARLIHRLGPRAGGPFVDVNCAAIPETLLESELFGYERGAFTDARHAKRGLFQSANHGTLFLDEIGLLPLALQAKLLKVLEEQAVRRLGSTTSEPIDVWIVSATNVDLRAAVQARTFREDLYHRLAVLTITLPALRDRGQDVTLLARRFLARACADYGLPAKTFAPEAEARLLAYSWPGNIRELGNMAERVALLAQGPVVGADVLELPTAGGAAPSMPASSPWPAASTEERTREQLLGVLSQTGWNISRTAARLGITRNTVRARIEKYRLRPATEPAGAAAEAAAADPARPVELAAVPVRLRWERRRITLLRAELAPEGTLDGPPGTARELETLMDKARGFGAYIDELSQNGIVAVFGLEPAEDTPQRAAHAALTIAKALERLRAEVGSSYGVRLAIDTSQCLVAQLPGGAQIDAEWRRQAGATLAALTATASPGVAVVSAATRPFLERSFRLERGGVDHDGTMPAWYRLAGHEPYGLGAAVPVAEFVGRQQELDLLKSRLTAAMGGQGQLVDIVGEAGIGKSRLLFELRRRVASRSVGYVEGRCVSYGSQIPYLPVLDLIRKGFGIVDTDRAEVVADKIGSVLDALHLDRDDSAPYLLNLLGFKEGTKQLEHLSPEAVKARTFETLKRVTLRAAQNRPIIIAVEDLHWIDRTSEELLASLAEGLPGGPVLLVTTYRTGYRPPWVTKAYASQIALPPLSAEESRSLVRAARPAHPLPEPLAQVILSRAEGNPFFIEELTRAVAEHADLQAEVAVPDTVQGVLMARIERLPDEQKRLLQTAAVLGRKISSQVLAIMWDDAPQLAAALRDLERLELLYAQRAGEQTAYVFKHALIQEVAYESLLPPQRRALHAAAGRALEQVHAGRLEEAYDRLAYHFARTAETAKAVDYLARFAAAAAARYAYVEAVAALEQAVVRAPELPAAGQDRLIMGLVLRLAAALFYLGRFREILDLLAAHEERLGRLGDSGLTGLFHFQAGLVWSLMGDVAQSESHARKALEASEQSADEATMGKAQYVLALDGLWLGRPHEVVAHGTTATSLLERTGERYWLGLTHWVLGINYALVGRFDSALAAEARCGDTGVEMGSTRLETYAAWATGAIRAFMGEGEAGIEGCRRSLARSPDPFNTATALGYLGYAYVENGEPARAIEHLERAIELVTRFRHRYAHVLFTVYLAEALLASGDRERARLVAAEALRLATEVAFHYGTGLAQRVLGRLAQADGAFGEALSLLTQAREAFVALEAPHEVGRVELLLADLAHERDERDGCRAHLAAAHALFTRLGLPRYLERARRLGAGWNVALSD